jgi:hypothetical protein
MGYGVGAAARGKGRAGRGGQPRPPAADTTAPGLDVSARPVHGMPWPTQSWTEYHVTPGRMTSQTSSLARVISIACAIAPAPR